MLSKTLSLVVIAFTMLMPAVSKAQGDLLVYPKRLVFDGSKKTQQIALSNSGDDTARYLISVIQIRMKEDGGFETIQQPDPGQNFADKNFRFFPRSVVLGPNESQTVKIQLVNTGSLPAGEYRSHLYFRAEQEKKPLGEDSQKKDSGSISVRIVPIFGISIPVIIKVGAPAAQVSLSDIAVENNSGMEPAVKFTFNRTGNMSVYGDVLVEHISLSGKKTPVGNVQGIAVYAPTSTRQFRVKLDNSKGVDFGNGKLKITYAEQAPAKTKLAEGELILN